LSVNVFPPDVFLFQLMPGVPEYIKINIFGLAGGVFDALDFIKRRGGALAHIETDHEYGKNKHRS